MVKYKADLANVGVQVEKGNGELKSTYEILTELKPKWDAMTDSEKANFQTKVVGLQQGKIFAAVMSQMEVAQKSYNEALNSSGETMRQNEKYMDSIEAKFNIMRAELEKLVLGEGGLQNFAKNLIDVGTAILKFANSDIGSAIVKITALSLILGSIPKLFISITASIIGLETSEVSAIIATDGLKGAFDRLTASMAINPFGLLMIAISAFIVGLVEVTKKSMEVEDALGDIHEAATKFNDDVDQTKNKVESLKSQIESLNNQKLNITDEQQLNLLNQQEQSLKNQLAIEQERLRIAQQRSSEAAQSSLKQTVEYVDENGDVSEITRQEGLKKTIELIGELKQSYSNLESELATMAEANQTDTNEYKEKEKTLENLKTQIEAQENTANSFASALSEWASQLNLTVEGNQKLYDSTQDVIEEYNEFTGNTDDVKDSTNEQSDALDELAEQYGVLVDDIEEYMSLHPEATAEQAAQALSDEAESLKDIQTAYKDAISEIGSMDDAFISLNDAVNEYNSTGGFTLDTLSKLLSMGSEYISLLDFENGQVTVNKDAALALANAKIDEAEAMAISSAQAQIGALALDEHANSSRDVGDAASGAVSGLSAADAQIVKLALSAEAGAISVNRLYQALGGKGTVGDSAQGQQIVSALQKQITSLESVRGNLGKVTTATTASTKATKGGSGATKKDTSARNENKEAIEAQTKALQEQKDALEAQKKALEDQIDKYKLALEYALDQLEKRIDKLTQKEQKALDKIVVKAQKVIGTYEGDLNEIDKMIKELEEDHSDTIDDLNDKLKDLTKDYKKDFKDIGEELAKLTKDYNKELESTENQIKELNKSMSVDLLEGQKQSVKDYYDNLISEIENANSSLEENIALQKAEESLAKAKANRVMVYKEGKWQYAQNRSDVQSAQENYAEIKREQEKDAILNALKDEQAEKIQEIEDKIKELEKEGEKSYAQQIADLEEHKRNIKAEYDSEVLLLENKRKEIVKNYEIQTSQVQASIDAENKAYDTKIAKLKELSNQYNATKEVYEAQIVPLTKLKEKLDAIKTSMDDIEKKQAFKEVFNIDPEKINDNWDKVAKGMKDFKDEYNEYVGQLKAIEIKINGLDTNIANLKKVKDSIDSINSTPVSVNTSGAQATQTQATQTQATQTQVKTVNVYKKIKQYKTSGEASAHVSSDKADGTHDKWTVKKVKSNLTVDKAKEYINKIDAKERGNYTYYASGVSSVTGNQIAITGENPNKEIVLGSKANGVLTRMDNGAGVVNAKSTKTLAGLLNQLGTLSNVNGVAKSISNNSNSNSTKIEIGNISLPSVKDGKGFVEYLQNFSADMIQTSFAR